MIGCPISKSLTTYCVCLELKSLPSTGITRLQRYYEPLRNPKAPGLSLAGVRLIIADHALGLSRVAYAFLVYMLSPLPRRSGWAYCFAHLPSRISLPRKGCRVGLRIVLFEACSAFTRVTACTLALSPIRDTLTEGFSHFVSSMTAPIASGWSGCRVGFAPTGKAPPFHGAHPKRTSACFSSSDDFDDAHHALVFMIDCMTMVDKPTDGYGIGERDDDLEHAWPLVRCRRY